MDNDRLFEVFREMALDLVNQARRIALAVECDVKNKHGLSACVRCGNCGCTLNGYGETRCRACGSTASLEDDHA